MKKYVLISLIVFLTEQISACTIFTASNSKTVFVGNNEDYSPGIKSFLWVRPKSKAFNGYVFWGFQEKYPEGGMNDKGLFIDAAALPEEIAIKKNPEKPDFEGYLTEKILKECGSVADVIALVGQYNLTWQQKAQIIVVDKSGDYAVIHANYITRKVASSFVLTNFSLNLPASNNFTCWRKNTAIAELKANPISIDLFRDILSKTAQAQPDNATIYSQVCDLTNGNINLYFNRNFDQAHKISLNNILKKGRRNIEISSIFPKSIGTVMQSAITQSGISKSLTLYHQLKKSAAPSTYNFSEKELDDLAYKLLNQKKIEEAVAVFKLNNQVYPGSANAIAGLANAYLVGGDTRKADSLYEKIKQIDTCNVYPGIFQYQTDGIHTFRINGFGAASHIHIFLKNIRSKTTIDTELQPSIAGQWTTKVVLPPGEYSYSYKVDDSWMIDPNNKLVTKVGQYTNSYLISR